jgi:tetratricopeptide (TPR) repeat protein
LNAPNTDHPDLEIQSAFIEGSLDEETTLEVVRHLSRCATCRLVVERAAEVEEEFEESERAVAAATSRSPSGFVIAISVIFAMMVVTVVVLVARRPVQADPIMRMASVAPLSARRIEPRLSGGFRWAPYRNLMASTQDKSSEELTAGSVAGQVLHELKEDKSARALHAKGIAHLVRGEAAAAVSALRKSADLAPRDARIWNDLAAALYMNAQVEAEWRDALEAARRAIRLDPRQIEPYFNVALILERIGTKEEVRSAWGEYLRHDPSSDWSDEAKERLAHYQKNH